MNLGNTTYTFVMIKNPKHDPKEPYIYFISDMKDARAIANHYLKRWKIECCFKHLKSNGFNIEDINLKIDDKIELMMGVLAIVYIIAVREGLLSHKLKPIPLKKYNNGKIYLSISIFRMGLAIIQTLFTKINKLIEHIENQLKANIQWEYGNSRNFILTKNV
jgi:transposase